MDTNNNREWLKTTKIQYAPEIGSHHKKLAFIVIPAKRILRKMFAFIGIPLLAEIDAYHSRLVMEIESARADAAQATAAVCQEAAALRAKSEDLQAECDRLQARHDALSAIVRFNADVLRQVMKPKAVSSVGEGEATHFVMLDERDNDPVTTALRAGNWGEIEKGLADMFPERPEKVFVDLGGNVGAFSLFMAFRGWRGYAFEASPHNAELLRDSIAINDFPITVYGKAVSDYTGSLYFVNNGPWSLVVKYPEPDKTYDKIDCVALDDMLDNAFKTVEKIDLIKMDIEGSEAAALRGMTRFLARYDYPPLYMEVNAVTLLLLHETPFSLLNLANEQGYTAYTIESDGTLAPLSADQFPTARLFDVLLLKEIPPHLPYRIAERVQPEDSAIVDWLFAQLMEIDQWPTEEFYKFYLLYALKDFPSYYRDERIYAYLKDGVYRKKLSEHPSLAFVADWIKQI